MSESVGVRELRQNLSVYLRRVAKGERFTVTDHNVPVALLTPVPASEPSWEQLLAEHGITPPTMDLADIGEPLDLGDGSPGTAVLEKLRADRV